ncbi:MAG: Gfo/Idh/MocA family oxidoreductase [Planctomycetota bacterium]|nr:Gfo/Idh/MocA family oxidoreductase [Planctomycetota bacterium]
MGAGAFENIGVAVAGTGFIGPVHVEGLRRLGVRVTGVLGSTPEKSKQAAKSLGLPKGYADFDELLKDADVSAVHLAVPNVLHYEMTVKALAAGKHVMCEKPLAMDARETADLVARARKAKRAAGVCYNIRFYPLNIEARERVASGALGAVHSVAGAYVQDWLLYQRDYNWRVLADKGGALRAVADIGTHWIDLVTSIAGLEVAAVFADLHTVHATRLKPSGEVETFTGKLGAEKPKGDAVKIDTEDLGNVLFRFTNGARGNLHVSQVTGGRKNTLRYEVAGADGALAWTSETPNELWLGHRDRANETLARDPALLSDRARGYSNYPGGHNEGFPDTFKQCFRAFYEYIAAGNFEAPPYFPDFAAGHREVVLCEAILASHRGQQWVEVQGMR